MLKCLLAGMLALVMFCGIAVGADHPQRTITVSGEGTASVAPDIAYVHLEVVTDHETVSKAMAKSKVATTNVFAALKKNKVAEKDICTHSFSISPKYKYVKDQEPQLVGYTVQTGIKVTVRDLDKTGDLLDALTADGHASYINGVSFDVTDKTKVSDTARENAVNDAMRKARLLAKTSGARLGKVLTITEGGGYSPRPYSLAFSARADSAPGGDHLAKGEQTFRVTVNLVVGLED